MTQATRLQIDVADERIRELVDGRATLECLATGFVFIEGPIWNAEHAYLLFSDIPGNTRARWDAEGGSRIVAAPTNNGNGMTLDEQARLIVCEHATSVLVRMDANGTGAGREVIASHYEGRELNSPNDVIVHSDGSIWFTDPASGRSSDRVGIKRDQELDFQAVFRLPLDGMLTPVANDFELCNGLCFSPDESLLYVNDTPRAHIRVFEVASDGSLDGGRVFAEGIGTFDRSVGFVDGMKCDARGNVWVTGPHGLWVFDPDGTHLGVIRTPEVSANLHWGGPDWTWLFVTATSGLYRIVTSVGGSREPFMR